MKPYTKQSFSSRSLENETHDHFRGLVVKLFCFGLSLFLVLNYFTLDRNNPIEGLPDPLLMLGAGIASFALFLRVQSSGRKLSLSAPISWFVFAGLLLATLLINLLSALKKQPINVSVLLFPVLSWAVVMVPYGFVVFENRIAWIVNHLYLLAFSALTLASTLAYPPDDRNWILSVLIPSLIVSYLFLFFHRHYLQIFEKSLQATASSLNQSEWALNDSQTGLANQRAQLIKLEQSLIRLKSNGEQFGAILIGLDRLSGTQANHPPETLNQALFALAHLANEQTRKSDSCGRWNEDQFLLVVGLSSADGLKKYGERLRYLAEKLRSSRFPSITISLALTLAHPKDEAPGLLARLTESVEKAKKEGGNRWIYCER